jgi:hypothetical protein
MYTYAQIRERLFNMLKDLITDEETFRQWLDKLDSDNEMALVVSLFIDLEYDHLSAESVANVLNMADLSQDDARGSFCSVIENEIYQPECILRHNHGPQVLHGDRYVRVTTLESIFEHYFRNATTMPMFTPEIEDELLRNFFADTPLESLSIVRKVWRGKTRSVWVGSLEELNQTLIKLPKDQRANAIRDRLGFYGQGLGRLVGVIYPERFATTKAFIPTTLDAHSECRFFLSIHSDNGWGLTCGLHPDDSGMKERVHEALDGLSDEYYGVNFGEITLDPTPDPDHLFREALRRS